jgi:alpha-1,6-mannosyltransferase
MPMTRLFRASVALLCGLTLATAAQGDWTRDTPRFLVHWLAMAVLYLAVLFSGGVFRAWAPALPPRDLRWALVAFGTLRVMMAFGEPMLSDDVYRSVWEGRVQRAGGNPFAWSDRPEAEKWAGLRDGYVYPRINHPDYAAIYPPAWQWAMRFTNALSDSVTAVKLFLVGCELLFWLGLRRLLVARGLCASRVLIAAASPLALVEIAGGGHNEAMGMAFLVWALFLLESKARPAAVLALVVAILSKLIPAILAFPWLRRLRLRDFALMGAVGLFLSLPFIDETALWSLRKYGDYWRFNETLFALFAALSGSHRAGALVSATALVALGVWLARRESDLGRVGL